MSHGDSTNSPLQVAVAFVRAIEARASEIEITRLLDPDVVHVEHPNLIAPRGATRDLAGMLAGIEKGKRVLAVQRYEIDRSVVDGDEVVLEMRWEGELAIAFGALAVGAVLSARIAQFFSVRNGRICRIVNYDCYPPFGI